MATGRLRWLGNPCDSAQLHVRWPPRRFEFRVDPFLPANSRPTGGCHNEESGASISLRATLRSGEMAPGDGLIAGGGVILRGCELLPPAIKEVSPGAYTLRTTPRYELSFISAPLSIIRVSIQPLRDIAASTITIPAQRFSPTTMSRVWRFFRIPFYLPTIANFA